MESMRTGDRPEKAPAEEFPVVEPAWLLDRLFQPLPSGGAFPGVVAAVNAGHEVAGRPYRIPWSEHSAADRERLFDGAPPWVGSSTSGHTGLPRLWVRGRNQWRAEVDALSAVLGGEGFDAVVSFAPIFHSYGTAFTLFLPMVLGLDMWFWPMTYQHPVRLPGVRRPLFATIPSALRRLDRQADGLLEYDSVTVAHSTAVLPTTARSLTSKLGGRGRVFDLFGSTEAGMVAWRTEATGLDSPWELAPDVELVRPSAGGTEAPLCIAGPRLAHDDHGVRLTEWEMDDVVRLVGPRRFVLVGRRSQLVNVNGRRVYLNRVEDAVRDGLPCQDVASVATRDEIGGEGFDVFLVPDPERPISSQEARRRARAVLRELGQPRNVHLVGEIPRTATGKIRLADLRS
jgi:acyl-coenzyme A synthetase/AMP-(fatty) acid ligase